MTKVLNSFFAAALMLTATSVAAYDPPEMANWQIKAKEKALQLHERTFEGEAFDWGVPTSYENRVKWARKSKEAKKVAAGNVEPKHLRKLLSGSVLVEWNFKNWTTLNTRDPLVRLALFAPDGKRIGCMLDLNRKAEITEVSEYIGYWEVDGADTWLSASNLHYEPTVSEVKDTITRNAGVVPIYDRTNGLIATYNYHKNMPLLWAGSIQKGIPKFAYDACEVFQNIPNVKIVNDQTIPDFNTHLMDSSSFVKKKVPTLFPQDIFDPLTAEMIYFDLDPDRYARRVITKSFD